ncbi:MAG: hypothetical protein EOO24_42325 [Comamonadaceae bacterium]|nr:MAG: hypothetical protein EOO24_42325 [Comamonadaceae bacterium]
MKPVLAAVLALAGLLGSATAPAQTAQTAPLALSPTGQPGQPTAWTFTGDAARIAGYGPFRFGMPPGAVQAAAALEWPMAVGGMTATVDAAAQTRALALALPSLPPAPGAATVHFAFAAKGGTLVAITVNWVLDGDPDAAQRDALVRGAAAVAAAYAVHQWPDLTTVRGHVVGPHALVVFAGQDVNGAAVEVRLDGVGMDVIRPGTPAGSERRAAPHGPARLRLALAAQPGRAP